jgi:thioesterase domain-containing protein
MDGLARQFGAPGIERTGLVDTEIEEALHRFANALAARNGSFIDDPLAWARTMLTAAENNHQRMSRWKVRAVDVPITLLRTSGDNSRGDDYGWSEALGRAIEVLPIPGEHHTIIEPPFVKTLASCIEGILAQNNDHTQQR